MKHVLLTSIVYLLVLSSNAQDPKLQKLWEKQQKGKYEQVIKESNILLQNDPENIEYNHLLGRAYFGKGDMDNAIVYLEKSTITDDPKSYTKAWSYNFLGKCYLSKNELAKAEDYFYKSYSMHATKNVTNSSYRHAIFNGLLKPYGDWTELETEHFIFYFQDSVGMNQFANSREKAYDSISNYLDVYLNQKIRYVVWTSRENARQILNMNIGFSKPSQYLIHSKSTQTPGHEVTHVISHYIADLKYKTGLINEGIAVYLDMADKDEKVIVQNAMKKYNLEKLSIKSFWTNWRSYHEELSYAVAGLFVGELIEFYGKEKFLEFFTDQSYKNAQALFGKGFNDFIKEFESKFNEI
ncbi:MAG: tetratricopeptide repeat protein [Bacteroidetes bacterium]|nr:tetratricopeptide repeat protein [Bacteroidota bacterium]